MMSSAYITIIGAGIAGLSRATAHQRGLPAQPIRQEWRTRRAHAHAARQGKGWQCDHGAQYFTARDPAFRAEVARWEQAGAAGPGLGMCGDWLNGGTVEAA